MDMTTTNTPLREIRAVYDYETIRVYQAYGAPIANALNKAGRFVEPFKLSRMTWIKPSYLWMMYRCGWSYKDDGQRRVFAFDITREGFEWALAHSCSSHPKGLSKAEARELMDAHPVRVQWDPERDIHHNPLEHRSIQIGLTGEAIQRYVNEWFVNFEEITDHAREVKALIDAGDLAAVQAALPHERALVLPDSLASHIGAMCEGGLR